MFFTCLHRFLDHPQACVYVREAYSGKSNRNVAATTSNIDDWALQITPLEPVSQIADLTVNFP